jgi:ribonuclease J
VHSSGHPRQDELKLMYEWLKPNCVIPMHGEARHLRFHANFAKAQGVPHSLHLQNGKIARLAPGPVEVIDEAPFGALHVDGKLIVESEDGPAKQRRKLSFVGIIFATVLIGDDLLLAEDIGLFLDGVPVGLKDGLVAAAEKEFNLMPKPRRKDDATVEEVVRIAIRRAAELTWGKKPVVKVALVRV